jgi:hypothetical protein
MTAPILTLFAISFMPDTCGEQYTSCNQSKGESNGETSEEASSTAPIA